MPEHVEARPLIVLPYTTRIDRFGKIRLSSHSNLITLAVSRLYKQSLKASLKAELSGSTYKEGKVSEIYIPGENTFGLEYPSTAELMKRRLTVQDVPENKIHTEGNLNDTESQLKWVRDQQLNYPLVLALGFHTERVSILASQLGLGVEVVAADPILLNYHAILTPEKLERIVSTQARIAGVSKVQLAEFINRTGVRFGKPGKACLRLLRAAIKAEGPTVTDYRYVGPARTYLQEVLKSGIRPHP